jgi:uncharacterized RDD family membrane protein YckC
MPNSWYYAAGSRQMGPVSETELQALVESGVVGRNTLVWHEGLPNWLAYQAARPDKPAPVAAPPALTDEVPGDTAVQPTRFCTQCGRATPERELAQFGSRLVCANCKPAFTHELRERGVGSTHYRYAGFWIRFLARLIDSMLLYVVILPVTFLVVGMRAFDPNNQDLDPVFFLTQGMLMLFNICLAAGYEVWFLVNYSATPGKMAVGKKVIVADGSRMTYGRALARYLASYISYFTLLIGYIMAAFDDEKRTLHDRICDTRVVAK